MISLWRIQRKDEPRRGPFTTLVQPGHPAWDNLPPPCEEGHDLSRGYEFCAFKSLEDLHEYFPPDDPVLSHPDFEVVVIEARRAIILNNQAIFRWEHVERWSPINEEE